MIAGYKKLLVAEKQMSEARLPPKYFKLGLAAITTPMIDQFTLQHESVWTVGVVFSHAHQSYHHVTTALALDVLLATIAHSCQET